LFTKIISYLCVFLMKWNWLLNFINILHQFFYFEI
jgi:hypothetical protein